MCSLILSHIQKLLLEKEKAEPHLSYPTLHTKIIERFGAQKKTTSFH